MKKILIDSGPLIALFDRNDKYHSASLKLYKGNDSELVAIFTTKKTDKKTSELLKLFRARS